MATETKTISPEAVKLAGVLLKQEHSRRVELEKEAAQTTIEKRAQKIAFREVELGIAEPYKTHEEFQQKVASLMGEDLDVVEKALDRGYGSSAKAGTLVGETGKQKNPFEHFVLTGELVSD